MTEGFILPAYIDETNEFDAEPIAKDALIKRWNSRVTNETRI